MVVSAVQKRSYLPSNSDNSGALVPPYTPVKSGPQTNYGNNRWEVFSPKIDRNITLYSNLEYDHWVLVESNPEIVDFCEQPLRIKIRLPMGTVTTIFDMWVKWESGDEEFREIKFEDELLNPKPRTVRQLQAQKKWCEIHEKDHVVITDNIIRSNPIYLSNWRLILRYLDRRTIKTRYLHEERILRLLADKNRVTFGQITRILGGVQPEVLNSTLFAMIYSHKLKVALGDKPLDMESILEKADA